MSRRSWFLVAVPVVLVAGVAVAQFPVMNAVADKVIQKYQSSSCEQLWQEKAQGQGKPKPEMEQRAIQMLKQDAQMRQAFFDKVAAPIVNKMFECGMIP
jgi:transposase-like protein